MSIEENKAVVESLWKTLYTKDWEKVKEILAPDAHYEDLPTPDTGADGPENIVKRLQIGLDPVESFEHHFHSLTAEGNRVILEHTEVWHFHTGEVVRNPFVTVHEVENGKITLWKDYWDLNTLMAGVPKWWIERLAKYSQDDFS